jgi:predicted deacetylase
MGAVAARLIVSLSGLCADSPESLRRSVAFVAELDARDVAASQLLRPRGPTGPLEPGSPLVAWMLERRVAGDAIVLHGHDHTPDPTGVRKLARRAEFASLPRHEAGLRLTAARRVLTAVGLRTELFVPPRWLASEGTVEALTEQGFTVLADENGVRCLGDGGSFVRARVLGFRVSGERRPVADDQKAAEGWRCRVLVAEVARTARRGGLVRINVRAKDLKRTPRREAVLAAVDAALELGAVPVTYRQATTALAA